MILLIVIVALIILLLTAGLILKHAAGYYIKYNLDKLIIKFYGNRIFIGYILAVYLGKEVRDIYDTDESNIRILEFKYKTKLIRLKFNDKFDYTLSMIIELFECDGYNNYKIRLLDFRKFVKDRIKK
jgi:hypothetical protein